MNVDNANQPFTVSMASRVALWGPTIVGFLGPVLAIAAAQSSDYTGAGLCLAASAFAFGVVGYIFLRR